MSYRVASVESDSGTDAQFLPELKTLVGNRKYNYLIIAISRFNGYSWTGWFLMYFNLYFGAFGLDIFIKVLCLLTKQEVHFIFNIKFL